ncbi:hypothetical protein OTU49_000724, partial [Cherax quadricarinatus]
ARGVKSGLATQALRPVCIAALSIPRTMKPLSNLYNTWMVVLVATSAVCFPVFDNDDARIGNLLDDNIFKNDLTSNIGLASAWSSTVPVVSQYLQPPDQEFQFMAKDIPTGEAYNTKKVQLKKPSTMSFISSEPSRVLEPPSREFGSISKKSVYLEGVSDILTTPQPSNVKPIIQSEDSELQFPVGNTMVPSASRVKVPIKSFQSKILKPYSLEEKKPTKSSVKNKKNKKPTQFLEPPVSDFGVESTKMAVAKTSPVFLPASYLMPPSREFTGLVTQEIVPPTREFGAPMTIGLIPPTREFALPTTREMVPPTHETTSMRHFLPLIRDMTPPNQEFAVPPPRTMLPPTREFFRG